MMTKLTKKSFSCYIEFVTLYMEKYSNGNHSLKIMNLEEGPVVDSPPVTRFTLIHYWEWMRLRSVHSSRSQSKTRDQSHLEKIPNPDL